MRFKKQDIGQSFSLNGTHHERKVEKGESSQLNEARLFLQKERVRDFRTD